MTGEPRGRQVLPVEGDAAWMIQAACRDADVDLAVEFFVAGIPVTQGNKSAFVNKSSGKAVMREGRSKTANTNFHSWREGVANEARAVAAGRPGFPYDCPVVISLTFGLQRPKSAPKRRRTWPTGARSGDADKLARAVLDALTGVLMTDDSLCVGLSVTKDFAARPGVRVQLWPADDEAVDWIPEWSPALSGSADG
jgi:crossover junction endodeoxyribonuclease RusA